MFLGLQVCFSLLRYYFFFVVEKLLWILIQPVFSFSVCVCFFFGYETIPAAEFLHSNGNGNGRGIYKYIYDSIIYIIFNSASFETIEAWMNAFKVLLFFLFWPK